MLKLLAKPLKALLLMLLSLPTKPLLMRNPPCRTKPKKKLRLTNLRISFDQKEGRYREVPPFLFEYVRLNMVPVADRRSSGLASERVYQPPLYAAFAQLRGADLA